MSKLQNITMVSILLALALVLLVKAEGFLIPLLIAVVIWYLIITIANALNKLRIPYPLALLGSLGICFLVIWGLFSLITTNVATVVSMAPIYQERLELLINKAFAFVGIDHHPKLAEVFTDFNFTSLATNLASTATDIAGRAGVILIYIIFLLLEHHLFDAKLKALIKDGKSLNKTRGIIQDVASKVQSYLIIKTLTSLLTGVCSYLVLLGFGVDFADFWALLIFLLNFIPTIGSIVATILASLMTLLQFGELTPFLIVGFILSSIQFFVGNILEPRLMGRSFNLSPLVIVLFLAIWGQIWGIVGMFLCVPIMVIAMIICSNFDATRPLAIIFSERGEVR